MLTEVALALKNERLVEDSLGLNVSGRISRTESHAQSYKKTYLESIFPRFQIQYPTKHRKDNPTLAVKL